MSQAALRIGLATDSGIATTAMNPGTSKKGYGLFIPKSKLTSKPSLATKASALFEADDDEDDDGGDEAKTATVTKKNATSTMFGNRKSEFEAKLKKQQEIEIEKVRS